MVIPASNIVAGPYAWDARVKEAEFFKSSAGAPDCPNEDRSEFALLGRSNVGKSSLINALIRCKEAALTSKKPGLRLHLNQLEWIGLRLPKIGLTFVFAKCDKSKKGKGGRPEENIKEFQDTISALYPERASSMDHDK